jgi:hypothetical protein
MSASANPHPSRPLHWFIAHAIAWTLLLGLWPAPRAAYPALFHAHANALLAAIEAPHVRLAAPGPGSLAGTDTAMRGAPDAEAAVAWESSFGVVRIGYWPSIVLAAMLLATPLSLSRRALAVATGIALVDLFTLARIGIEIAYASYEVAVGPGGPTRSLAHLVLRVGSESLTATIPSAAFVLVCWVVLAHPRRTIDLGAVRAWIGQRRAPAR